MKKLSEKELFEFLEENHNKYEHPSFIESDPVSVPHLFTQKKDIEIAGFLAATIAWGQRKTIISNAKKLVNMMDNSPYDFIQNFSENDLKVFKNFKHRTFNGIDCIYFLQSLKNIYKNHGGLEKTLPNGEGFKARFCNFHKIFFALPHPFRTEKHISNPEKGSSAKRLNMFLRWLVRPAKGGVDFGLWKKISPADLLIPLDVHTGNVARKLGLLKRKQNDWRAVEELTSNLKKFDNTDPVKYDFALFGLGIYEKFNKKESFINK